MDGIAIKIRVIIGIIVHKISIIFPSRRNRFVELFILKDIIIRKISVVMKIKIIIVKSWKKIIIS